jgi:hypothetical protein
MSCDGNRAVYFAHLCATVGAGSGVTPADLETHYERQRGQPQSAAEALLHEAKTRKLFAEMRKGGIAPPTHSSTGLPKLPSRRGYAAIYDELKRRGWLADGTADDGAASVPVTADPDGTPAPGMLADAGATAPAAPPRVAVQGTRGRIDAVAFRVQGGPTRYVWGGTWLAMKEAVKAIPGGAKRPWFNPTSKVWEVAGTEADAAAALTALGWQLADAPPSPTSVIRAGATLVDGSGAAIPVASGPTPVPPLVPVHGADGSVAWMPEGTPARGTSVLAAPTPHPAAPVASVPAAPAAPVPTAAQLVAQAEELLKAAPRLIDGANTEATLEVGTPTSARLTRWAAAARASTDPEVRNALAYGSQASGAAALTWYARAACQAAGVPRCPTCQQFQARDGSHVCPSKRYDANGYNPAGVNRRGFDRDGFTALNLDAEGYDRSGLRVVNRVYVNRQGYTSGNVRLATGTHASGYFPGYRDGLDFFGYSPQGYDAEDYDRTGYHRVTGRDRQGVDRTGRDATGAAIAGRPDAEGFYGDGRDADGYDRDGYAPDGQDAWGFARDGYTVVRRNGVARDCTKDGRDRQGMRYAWDGCNLQGMSAAGYTDTGVTGYGEPRTMRSPKTGRLVRATYAATTGVDAEGFTRRGFSVRDGLSAPDASGRRVAPNGWVVDPATGDLADPDDPSRRMAHRWTTEVRRMGRLTTTVVISTGTPPPFTPPEDGHTPPTEIVSQRLALYGARRDPPTPLASAARMDRLRVARDPEATTDGIRLQCPYCKQFTGAVPHVCPPFAATLRAAGLDGPVVVSRSGVVVASDSAYHAITRGASYTLPAATIVFNPAEPAYDPAYANQGYDAHDRDPDGFDRQGYTLRGTNRKGYTREGYDVLGFDADGYDRSGYNRHGKNREGQERPLTVAELRRSLAPGEEPLSTEGMARHYSRLAQAITNKPVVVTFDTSIPTGGTDMRGNIMLNPHPLGKDADPARNMLVVKAIMYHEVGHELTTNGDHWAELKGIAASPVPVEGIDKGRAHVLRFYNIVEDGRMERDMSDRFPGVAGALAAAARLRDKWDFAVGARVPTLHQVTGALLYTTLPYYRVPQEVVERMTPEARALYEELRPIALQGALGSPEDALAATKEIVRRLERAGVFATDTPAQTNIEITPPGGSVGNTPPKPPKPPPAPAATPPPADAGEGGEGGEGGESGEGGEDAPNGRGKGWRKGQKTASDAAPSERQDSGDANADGSQGGAGGSQGEGEDDSDEDADGDGNAAGGAGGGAAGGAGGGAADGAGGSQEEGEEDGDEAGSSAGGSAGGDDGEENESGDGAGGAGGSQEEGEEDADGAVGGAGGGAGGDDGDADDDGDEADGAGGVQDDGDGDAAGAGKDDGDAAGGAGGGAQGGSPGEADGDAAGGAGGGAQGGSDEEGEDGDAAGAGGSQRGQGGHRQGGDDGADAAPNWTPPATPDALQAPELGDGDDTLGGDGSSGAGPPQPVAIAGERFDPLAPFTDAELDAALKAADREAAQVIAAQVRRQANYSVLGKRLHRRLSTDRTVSQAYRTLDGRAAYVDVVQPRSTNAAHLRTLDGFAGQHRAISGKLARQLQTIRAQADQRIRFQTSGKLDQRRIVAAVRGADEVRVQVREQPATRMAISLTLDFSGSMYGHVSSGKVYHATSILGSTFEQLAMPYEVRGHADTAAVFKAMEDDTRDPARMAMTAVIGNGCGIGNGSTAPTMGLATAALLAREEPNKLIVSLMDGDMGDHAATVAQLGESRTQGVVTFGVFLGQPSAAQQQRLAELFGAGSWVAITDLAEMPQAIGRRLARVFESLGKN